MRVVEGRQRVPRLSPGLLDLLKTRKLTGSPSLSSCLDCKAVDGLAAGRKTCFNRRLKEQNKSRQLKCGRARNSGHGKASSKLTVRVSYK